MRSQDASLTVIDLIRHGEPEGGRKFRGSTDHPLSQTGWQQMQEAVRELAPWDAIVTSPLLRCREFAAWLGDRHQLTVEVDQDLAELHLGAWEGLTHAQAREVSPATTEQTDGVNAFWAQPLTNPPPQGESLQDFDLRVARAWKRLHEQHAGRHLLVVAHLFTCNLLLRQVLQQPLEKALSFDLPYAGLTRIRCESGPAGTVNQLEWLGLEKLPDSPARPLNAGR
ncbi:alpha-ribazole phosphatase family protein [Marinospirillum sp.]|uniref:histidine phosphatase family protein n=1 Tax=Marinospirillum sp. TaxID=2183934 RepID=UPI0028709FCA|nr:alpha-ribazole phosphatase family protein [Marinospirillum sp.]MDR9469025.1 alpha-ribazole phosphatase family protein [Marinospirillum sp.]